MSELTMTPAVIVRSVVVAAVLGAWAPLAATAQDAQADAMLACDKIKDDDARLICFNAVVTALKGSRGARAATVENFGRTNAPTQRTLADESSAGEGSASSGALAAPEAEFGLPAERRVAPTPDEIIAGLVSYKTNAQGLSQFELDNGQIWVETTNSGMIIPRDAGSVRIKKGFLGSFRIFVEGANTSGRVKRVR